MNTQSAMMRQAAPIPRATTYAMRRERLARPSKVLLFDGSNDPEVCCAFCGAFLGRNSSRWWDDYTCTFCHDAH